MGWLSGWGYRMPVIVKENSGNNLTNYQVRIELNSSNFDFSLSNADGSDIRVTADDGETLLNHYIERWDGTNKQATIWVKVPNIPANGKVTLYLYYGNPSATDQSDPSSVFDFFDGFETWEGWVQHGNGVVSQSSDYAYSGQYSAKKSNYGDPNGAYKQLGFVLDYPFILEAMVNRTYFSGANADRIGVIDDNGNGYGPCVVMSSPNITIDKRSSYSGSTTGFNGLSQKVSNDWYLIRFIWNNGNMVAEAYYNGSNLGSHQYTDTSYTSFTRVYIFGGYTYYVDNLRIRKYADPEPTVILPTNVYIYTGQGWTKAFVYIWDGSEWKEGQGVLVWDGSEWKG